MAVRIEVCILFMIVMFVAWSYTVCGCTKGGARGVLEGITNAIDSVSSPSGSGTAPTTGGGSGSSSSDVGFFDWINSFFVVSQKSSFDNMGKYFSDISFNTVSNGADPGMHDFFRGVSFSSNCCPSEYSTDTGCACLDQAKYDIIRSRGGNNMPISQW